MVTLVTHLLYKHFGDNSNNSLMISPQDIFSHLCQYFPTSRPSAEAAISSLSIAGCFIDDGFAPDCVSTLVLCAESLQGHSSADCNAIKRTSRQTLSQANRPFPPLGFRTEAFDLGKTKL